MNNCPINISTSSFAPFVIPLPSLPINYKEGDVLNLTEGIEVEMIKAIGSRLKFRPFFRFHDAEDLGRIYDNNTSNGVLGAVLSRESSIGIGNIKPNDLFHQKFDFTVQYAQVYL